MGRTAKEIQNGANVKALKRAREMRKLSRGELASRLGLTYKTVEKYENGRDFLSEERLLKILEALEISKERFEKIRRGKGLRTKKGPSKTVYKLSDRRSYKKKITKACKTLRSLRRIKCLSQEEAANLCGYARQTIGHVENGRVDLTESRIRFIINCYGYSYDEFQKNFSKEELRDEIIDDCKIRIESLSDEKLSIVKNLLRSL